MPAVYKAVADGVARECAFLLSLIQDDRAGMAAFDFLGAALLAELDQQPATARPQASPLALLPATLCCVSQRQWQQQQQ